MMMKLGMSWPCGRSAAGKLEEWQTVLNCNRMKLAETEPNFSGIEP